MEVGFLQSSQRGTLLGVGTFGRVYSFTHPVDGKTYALKVLPLGKTSTGLREVQVLAHLEHPNIVRYYGSFIKDDHLFIQMELCGHGSLEQMDTVSWSLTRKLRTMLLVARGVAYLHGLGVCHRDLKPANILFRDAGDVKVADFGIAVVATGGPHDPGTADSYGTYAYTDPAVYDHRRPPDTAADVYSLGVLLAELLGDFQTRMERALHLSALRHHAPTATDPTAVATARMQLDACVAACVNQVVEDRPDATQLTHFFGRLLGQVQPDATIPDADQPGSGAPLSRMTSFAIL
jgi:serine/threonine protein kinase